MADDAHFEAAAETILRSPSVDVGLIGNVPFTPALRTTAVEGAEAIDAPGGVAARLVDLWRRTDKAWVTVVDAGPLYDPLARVLEAGGIPTFRAADAALRALDAFVLSRGS
jgi:acyl-CoA synthetase (NDP forming)